jgi:hypothetical protein
MENKSFPFIAVYYAGVAVLDGAFLRNHRNAPNRVETIVNKARAIFRGVE